MSKNLIVCLDGTGNQFGDRNSNVVKICQILNRDPSRQIVYYNPGVGTHPELYRPTVWGRFKHRLNNILDQATGRGVLKNACDAYVFLMNNCSPQDQVFVFGFSRGAYTARVLCAMLYKFGLIDKGNDNLVQYAATLLVNKTPKNDLLATGFSQTFGRDCPVHFLGAWDTVSSVRWLVDPPYVQHTKYNPNINLIRHAVAIDERRAYFRTNLFDTINNKQISEVWFPGAHADIGGSYREQESALSKISLEWMLREAEAAGVIVDSEDKNRILGGSEGYARSSATGIMHNEIWSASNLFGLGELLPKLTWDRKTRKRIIKFPLGKPRKIPEGAKIHESAILRKATAETKYNPPNFPKEYQVEK